MDIEEVKSKKPKAKDSSGSKIGEVIETSSAEFTAQCYKLDESPPLGSLVKTVGDAFEIIGVVYDVSTHGLEPGRRVMPRGENLEAEEDIFAVNPQLSRLLATDFRVLVVGYVEGKSYHHYLPSKSAYIHSFVYACRPEEVRSFTRELDFLSLIMNAKLQLQIDEVIGACLRNVCKTHHDPDAFLIRAGKELAYMLSSDVNRLNSLLKRLKG